MKKSLIFILFITIMAGFNSCDKPTEKQQEADALFQKITKIYTLHEDGSVDYQYKHELDLHSYYAFNSLYGETFIVYNPEYQEIKINQSETETTEGKKVPSPENAYNEVLPAFASGAPPYHHLREMVVTHTALERNSTIHLDYQIESAPEYIPFLMENEILAENSPVRKLVIKVRFPEEKELNYKIMNANENLNISKFGELKEYKWVFEDIPALKHEDLQPEDGQHLPRLMFSTKKWTDAYDYLTGELSENLPESASISIPEAVKVSKNRMDSILSIQDVVVSHINHFDIPFEHTGFRVRSNEEVLDDNGGTTLEKTWLLVCLLREMGVNAKPTAVIPAEYFNENIGNLKTTEKYYVQVTDEDEIIYLSAINDNQMNARYSSANEVNLLLDPENSTPKWTKPKQKASGMSIEGNLKLSNNNRLSGELDAEFRYSENPYLSIISSGNSVKSLLSPGFQASDIMKFQIKSTSPASSAIHYTLAQKVTFERQGEYRFLTIPEVHSGLDQWHLQTLTETRETPVEVGWPIEVGYKYTLAVPESFRLVNDDIDIQKNTDIGTLSIHFNQENGVVKINKHIQLNQEIIKPADYDKLKKIMNLWYKDNYRSLIFTRGGE